MYGVKGVARIAVDNARSEIRLSGALKDCSADGGALKSNNQSK